MIYEMVLSAAPLGGRQQQVVGSRLGGPRFSAPGAGRVHAAPARRAARAVRTAAQGGDRGRSGIDVNGARPTTPAAWEARISVLKDKVQFMTPEQLLAAAGAGRPVLDVRPEAEFVEGFIEGSVNVPLYQPIEGWDGYSIARRVGFALFGVLNGTEVNPNFMDEVAAALPGQDCRPIVVCNLGGALESGRANGGKGQQSRSLFAAYELIQAGYEGVAVLKGGWIGWTAEELPIVVYDDE